MNSLKISIVIPSLNQGEFLENTVRSVLGQKYDNLEFIIIDGGSTDGSIDIIKKYEHLLSYWISEKDSGQSNAINKGLKRATGDIIAYINSDDMYCPGAFHAITKYFENHPNCLWLCGNVLFMNEEGKVFSRKKPVYTPFILQHGSASIYQPGVFLRRRVLEDVGYLREEFHAIMDKEWFSRIAERTPPDFIDLDIAQFRWHSKSKSSSKKSSEHYTKYVLEMRAISERHTPSIKSLWKIYPRMVVFGLNQISRIIKIKERIRRNMRNSHL